MRKLPLSLLIIVCLGAGAPLTAQIKGIYLIKNCQKETRIDTYYKQVKFFWWWILERSNFQQQRLLRFSAGYQPDSIALRRNIDKMRVILPTTYRTPDSISIGLLRNNHPDEKAIWFTEVFAEKDKKGNFKVYAAYTVTFEGNDARIDEQRKDPRIKDVSFIFDEATLQALGKKLAAFPVSQDVHN